MSENSISQDPAAAPASAPAQQAASPTPSAVPPAQAPATPAPSRLGTSTLLLMWLWPIVVAAAGVLYLQRQTPHTVEAAVSRALADRPRVAIIDEAEIVRRALARGADPTDARSVRAKAKADLDAIAGNDTIVLPRQVVTAAPPRFYREVGDGREQP